VSANPHDWEDGLSDVRFVNPCFMPELLATVAALLATMLAGFTTALVFANCVTAVCALPWALSASSSNQY
jgi:hypothetical protein